jgi:hypothetical protein
MTTPLPLSLQCERDRHRRCERSAWDFPNKKLTVCHCPCHRR